MHSVFLLLMLLFIAVQFNDPDGLLWTAIYSVPALLMLLCIVRPNCFAALNGRLIRWFAVALMVVGTILFWPKTPGFWQQAVWWETESAREGMGMMVALLVTLSSFFVKPRVRPKE